MSTLLKNVILIALFVVLILPVQTLLAQEAHPDWEGTSQIAGKVLDESRKGIRNADVKLRFAAAGAPPPAEEESDQPNRAAAMAAASSTASGSAPAPQPTTSSTGWWVKKTDRDGAFTADGLRAGRWIIQVEAKGRTVRRAIIQLEEGVTTAYEVSLGKPLSDRDLKKMQEQLKVGDELFADNEFASARTAYQTVLSANPTFMPIHRSIALTYGREGDHANALKHLELALQEDAGNVSLLALTLQSAMEVGDEEQVQLYTDALFDVPHENADMLTQFALMLLQEKKAVEADAYLTRLIALFPDDANPYYFQGMAQLTLQNVPGAKDNFQKFIERAPGNHPQRGQAENILEQLANVE